MNFIRNIFKKKKHIYPDCTIRDECSYGEYGDINNAIWNIMGWDGNILLLRNKLEIFKIYIDFPDSFIADYHLDCKSGNIKLYQGHWEMKKWYKKKLIFEADNIYEGKRSFERI